MRKLFSYLLIPCLALIFTTVDAQNNGPAASPSAKVEAMAGTTTITIEYSRPSMKDREIFGGLLKYGEPWRTGANAPNKITFDKDVMVEGKSLAAGSYTITTVPGKESWEVSFHVHEGGGSNAYFEKTPAVKVMVEPVMLECTVETFLIDVQDLRNTSATLGLAWENTYVPIALGVK